MEYELEISFRQRLNHISRYSYIARASSFGTSCPLNNALYQVLLRGPAFMLALCRCRGGNRLSVAPVPRVSLFPILGLKRSSSPRGFNRASRLCGFGMYHTAAGRTTYACSTSVFNGSIQTPNPIGPYMGRKFVLICQREAPLAIAQNIENV